MAHPASRPRPTTGARLAFNFLPVTFDDSTIEAWALPFKSSDQLDALRRKLARTHVVVKLKQTGQIACIPFESSTVTG